MGKKIVNKSMAYRMTILLIQSILFLFSGSIGNASEVWLLVSKMGTMSVPQRRLIYPLRMIH